MKTKGDSGTCCLKYSLCFNLFINTNVTSKKPAHPWSNMLVRDCIQLHLSIPKNANVGMGTCTNSYIIYIFWGELNSREHSFYQPLLLTSLNLSLGIVWTCTQHIKDYWCTTHLPIKWETKLFYPGLLYLHPILSFHAERKCIIQVSTFLSQPMFKGPQDKYESTEECLNI